MWQNEIKILNRCRKLFLQFQCCSGAVLAIPESPPLIKMEWYRHAQTAESGDTHAPVAVLPQNTHGFVWVRTWWHQWPAVGASYRPTESWHGHWCRPAVLFVCWYWKTMRTVRKTLKGVVQFSTGITLVWTVLSKFGHCIHQTGQHSEIRSTVPVHPRTVFLCQQSVRRLWSHSNFCLAAQLVPHVHSVTSLHPVQRHIAQRLLKQPSPGRVAYLVEHTGLQDGEASTFLPCHIRYLRKAECFVNLRRRMWG